LIERGLSRVDVGGEECVEEGERGLVLAASGTEEAGEDGEGVSAGLGACAWESLLPRRDAGSAYRSWRMSEWPMPATRTLKTERKNL